MRWAGDPVATRQRGTFTAVTLALFCMEVSFLAHMLALPDMARLFGTSPEVTQDALSAYLLSQGAALVRWRPCRDQRTALRAGPMPGPPSGLN